MRTAGLRALDHAVSKEVMGENPVFLLMGHFENVNKSSASLSQKFYML